MKKKVNRYKNGGNTKNEWIADKVSKLLSEGNSLEQSQAISNAMYNSGDMKFQNGDTYNSKLKPIDYIQRGVTNDKLGDGYYVYNTDGKREFVTNQAYDTIMKPTRQVRDYMEKAGGIGMRVPGTEEKNYRPLDLKTDKTVNSKILPIDHIQRGVTNDKLGDGYYLNYNNGTREFITEQAFEDNSKDSAIREYLEKAGGMGRRIPGTEGKSYRPMKQIGGWQYNLPQVDLKGQTMSPQQDFSQIGYAPNYYDQNKTMFQTGQEPYNGMQVAPNDYNSSYMNMSQEQENLQPLSEEEEPKRRYDYMDYGRGFDIGAGAHTLGMGIKDGNAFDIATGGLKVLTGVGRNLASGMGYANRRNQILTDAQGKQIRASRPGGIEYGQDGGQMGQQAPPQEQGMDMMSQIAGALQQGAQPQEILQQLVESGMDENQATQIIQGVMQQMQAPQEQPQMRDGGEYLAQLKGKIIKNYTLNRETNNYEVEYE